MTTQPYEIRKLVFNYDLDGRPQPALRGVDLAVRPGDFMCLSGPSGSGKTTLLNIMGLIERQWEGDVHFFGQSLRAINERQWTHIRLFELGFIFQSFFLLPTLTAAENVEYFLILQGIKAATRRQRVGEALEAVGLSSFAKQRPQEMSGGQRQRVSIARALAKNPKVIIADEPTASLDSRTAKDVMDLLQSLNRKHQVSCLIASHDPLVMGMVDRHIQMQDGQLRDGGPK